MPLRKEQDMPAIKYSRQREAIKGFLMTRRDHPTAETVYQNVKSVFPQISLGTVYRNLTLLADMGEIARLRVGDGADHFDSNTAPHCHFVCRECGSVLDLHGDALSKAKDMEGRTIDGNLIEGHVTYFHGTCSHCLVSGIQDKPQPPQQAGGVDLRRS